MAINTTLEVPLCVVCGCVRYRPGSVDLRETLYLLRASNESMSRSSVRNRVLASFMALVLVGCGCTSEGCGNDLRFGSEMLAEWIDSDDFTLEVCVEDECTTVNITDGETIPWFGTPLDSDVPDSVNVEVTATADGDSRTASGVIELDGYRPNGGLCAPVCPGADVLVEGDTLTNAEPGDLPPRD